MRNNLNKAIFFIILVLFISSIASADKLGDDPFSGDCSVDEVPSLSSSNYISDLLFLKEIPASELVCAVINMGWGGVERERAIDKVKLLIKRGVNLDEQELETGWSALMFASRFGHYDIVKLLVASGAKLDLKDKKGHTALDIANSCGHFDIVNFLEAKSGLKARSKAAIFSEQDYIFILRCAVVDNNIEQAIALIDKMNLVDLNNQDKSFKDFTILMYAIMFNRDEIVKVLIEKGVDLSLKNADELTALMLAGFFHNDEIVKLLIKTGKAGNKLSNVVWGIHGNEQNLLFLKHYMALNIG